MSTQPVEQAVDDVSLLLHAAVQLHAQRAISEVCHVAMQLVRGRVQPSRLALFLIGKGRATLVGGLALPRDLSSSTLSLRDGLAQRLASGVPLGRNDFRARILVELDAAMAYPLLNPAHELVGLLVVRGPGTGGMLGRTEHDCLAELSHLIGSALDNARSHRLAERRALDRSLDGVSRVLGAARRFLSATDLSTLLGRILDEAIRSVDAEKGSLMLLDDEDLLAVRVVRGLPDAEVEQRINEGLQPCARFARGQGVAGKVLASGRPIRVTDAARSGDFHAHDRSHVRSLLCVPLVVDDEAIGVINISNHRSDQGFTEEHERLLMELAAQAAAAIRRTTLFEAVLLDPVTGVYVKPFVERRLREEVRRSRRYQGAALSLAAMQVDGLTALCGRFGESMVDEILEGVGAMLRRQLREYVDLAGHIGEGRFHLVMPETRPDQALVVCRRLADAVRGLAIERHGGREITVVTVSFAVACLGEESARDLARRVDVALDEALLWDSGVMIEVPRLRS